MILDILMWLSIWFLISLMVSPLIGRFLRGPR